METRTITPKEILADLAECIFLLQHAGPNRLVIDEDVYYKRLHKITDKYIESEDEDENI